MHSHWCAAAQVTKHFEGQLDPARKYVFAYMPHGTFPAGAAYAPLLPSWRALLPGITPVTLTASVMHVVPLLRDLLALIGARQVSQHRSEAMRLLMPRKSRAPLCSCGRAAPCTMHHVPHRRATLTAVGTRGNEHCRRTPACTAPCAAA
jgi:hypothetical protein